MTHVGLEVPLVLGRAETSGADLPLGSSDPIEPSRAVRRALADARRHAEDVERFVVATPVEVSQAALRSFARRALGPHGEDVPVAGFVAPGSAEALATTAAASLGTEPAKWRIGIAVGIDATGNTVAVCIEQHSTTQ